MTTKYFEDFKVGEVLETHGRTVTEADVVNFAGLTGDIGPLHMDAVYAGSTRYGRRLPHGQLIFVLSLGLAERVIEPLFRDSIIAFYGVDRLRFVHPVFIGDTIQLHRTVDKLEDKNNGALKAMYKIREQKMTQSIGVSCHTAPNVLKSALERHDFDCTQMALNAARIGQSEPQPVSFEATALPVANKKNLGVIAMKVFGQEKLNGKASVDELIRYSLSLPVSAAVVGMPKMDMLEKNVAVAKGFQPMSPTDRDKLFGSVGQHKVAMDRFFADHIDC